MKRVAIFVHGFNVRDDGAKSTDTLIPIFEKMGFEAHQMDYGFTELIMVRLIDGPLTARLQSLCEMYHKKGYEVTIVGHSNGGCLAWMSTHTKDAKKSPDQIVCINPALNPKMELGPCVKRAIVLYTPDDSVLLLTGLVNWWLKNWGVMGRVGYQGKDKRVINRNLHDYLNRPQSLGHSGSFKDGVREVIYPKVIKEFFDA